MPIHIEDAPDEADILIDRLLSGWELRVHLSPDPTLPFLKKEPRYLEALALPFIAISDDIVWGTTRRTHLTFLPGKDQAWMNTFSYTPHRPYYALSNSLSLQEILTQNKMHLRLLAIEQYQTVNFKTVKTFKPIWRMGESENVKAFGEAISDGRTFRLAIKLVSNAWLIAPVDIPYWYPDERRFKVTTDCDFLPSGFFAQRKLDQHLTKTSKEFLESTSVGRSVDLRLPPVFTFLEFRSDGSYMDMASISSSRFQQAEDAILLAEL